MPRQRSIKSSRVCTPRTTATGLYAHDMKSNSAETRTRIRFHGPSTEPVAMTNRYTVLQNRLQDLESLVHQSLSHPPSQTALTYHKAEDINKQISFLKNLLSAEISSRPTRPQHLAQIAQRLEHLESAFKGWVHTYQYYNYEVHHDDHDDGDTSSTLMLNSAITTCTCTESCKNDEEEEEGAVVLGNYDENVSFKVYDNSAFISDEDDEMGDQAPVLMIEAGGSDHQAEAWDVMDGMKMKKNIIADDQEVSSSEEGAEVGTGDGQYFRFHYRRVLARGVMLGVVMTGLFIVSFTRCFHFSDPAIFLPPT